MRGRHVLGARIVKVNQRRRWHQQLGEWFYEIVSLELDNGKEILFNFVVDEDDYAVEAEVWKGGKKL